ncbi:RICIN domain-containing protein [Microbispora sp. CA-102843]|uniref:RICIN domain-containing protein n=1 Tax=Microbispora sp. CA-102843 TaxID=3239952 RepID=UPI003D8DCF8A
MTRRSTGLHYSSDVGQSSLNEYAPVIQYTRFNTPNQQWQVRGVSRNLELSARHSGMCLDGRDTNMASQWKCDNIDEQKWAIIT